MDPYQVRFRAAKSELCPISVRHPSRVADGLSLRSAIDEGHEVMVLGVKETTMQADGAHDLFCSLLEVIRRKHIRRIRKQTRRSSRSSLAASSNLAMGFSLGR